MAEHTIRSTHGPSFLRWAGSKRQSLRQLQAVVPVDGSHYIEPFAGSAALFFASRPQTATLADLNGHLINALNAVKADPHELYNIFSRIPRSKDTYYQVRTELNESTEHSVRSAALFLYLNRNCFNGLWRTNQSGSFNVPFGGNEIGNYPPIELLISCSRALASAEIRNQDFRETLSANIDNNYFIYVDPPYFTSTERTFIEYGKRSFGKADLDDLISLLISADNRGARIALTYSSAMPIHGIPSHWRTVNFAVTRNVGGFKGSRKVYGEILYTNAPLLAAAQ